MSANPYLSGNFAPVTDELTVLDLEVTGEIPRELNGRLLRIGPNPVDNPDPATHHWFLGSGMVHGLRLENGRARWFKSRYVRDDKVVAALGGPPVAGPRGTQQPGEGVVNTNILCHAGKTLALVEAGNLPVELAYVYDQSTDRSDVVILAAQDFESGPIATVHLPRRVPFGFHGNWCAD